VDSALGTFHLDKQHENHCIYCFVENTFVTVFLCKHELWKCTYVIELSVCWRDSEQRSNVLPR